MQCHVHACVQVWLNMCTLQVVQGVVATCYECLSAWMHMYNIWVQDMACKRINAHIQSLICEQCTYVPAFMHAKFQGYVAHKTVHKHTLSHAGLENNMHVYSAIILTSTTHMGSLTHELTILN